MNADAYACARWWRAQAIIFPSAFERIERHQNPKAARASLPKVSWLTTLSMSALAHARTHGETSAFQWRNERTCVSDAKKRTSCSLAK